LESGKSSSNFKRVDKIFKTVSYGKINSNDKKNIFDFLSENIKKDSNKNSQENPNSYKLKDSNISLPKLKIEKMKKFSSFKSDFKQSLSSARNQKDIRQTYSTIENQNNFKRRFTSVDYQMVTPDDIFLDVKNKLFYSDQLQKLTLEKINLDGNSEKNQSFNNYTDNDVENKKNYEKKKEKKFSSI